MVFYWSFSKNPSQTISLLYSIPLFSCPHIPRVHINRVLHTGYYTGRLECDCKQNRHGPRPHEVYSLVEETDAEQINADIDGTKCCEGKDQERH
jgi:hypothetical protein